MKSYLVLFLLLLVQPCLAQLAYDQVPPQPKPARAFVDLTHTFSSTEQAALEDTLQTFYFRTHYQLVVVAVESVKPYAMNDYALTIGRKWGIGNQGEKKGIVLLWAKSDRKVFIATAQGAEGALPDALTDRVIHKMVLPAFKQGQFYEGLRDGSFQIMALLQREPVQPQLAATPQFSQPKSNFQDDPDLKAMGMFILTILGIAAVWGLLFVLYILVFGEWEKRKQSEPINGDASQNPLHDAKVNPARPISTGGTNEYISSPIYQTPVDEPTVVRSTPVEDEPKRKSDTSTSDSSSSSSSYSDQSFSYGSSSNDTFSGGGSGASY